MAVSGPGSTTPSSQDPKPQGRTLSVEYLGHIYSVYTERTEPIERIQYMALEAIKAVSDSFESMKVIPQIDETHMVLKIEAGTTTKTIEKTEAAYKKWLDKQPKTEDRPRAMSEIPERQVEVASELPVSEGRTFTLDEIRDEAKTQVPNLLTQLREKLPREAVVQRKRKSRKRRKTNPPLEARSKVNITQQQLEAYIRVLEDAIKEIRGHTCASLEEIRSIFIEEIKDKNSKNTDNPIPTNTLQYICDEWIKKE